MTFIDACIISFLGIAIITIFSLYSYLKERGGPLPLSCPIREHWLDFYYEGIPSSLSKKIIWYLVGVFAAWLYIFITK